MKKIWKVFPVVLMILTGLAFVTVFSCNGDDEDNNGKKPPPIIRGDGVTAYGFEWYTIDDANPNGDRVTPQTVFAPGGASRITNSEEYVPFVYEAGTVEDNDGNTIGDVVFNFTGVTKVSSANRDQEKGAQFPLAGWEAMPDDDTLELLRTAYSYSFWIRLNSSTASNWAFLTAVVTDFTPEKGYEYKHWFGNQSGDSGGNNDINNFTGNLEVGIWYQITVILDTADPGFNMEQDGWIHQYNPEYQGDFNQDKAERIQWQIPLQHQVDADVTTRQGGAYDVTNGEYEFDVDLYGFEFHN